MVRPQDIEMVRRVLDEEMSREAARTLPIRQLAMLGGVILRAGPYSIFQQGRKYDVKYGHLLYAVAVRAGKPATLYRDPNQLVNAARRLGVHYSPYHGEIRLAHPEWMSPFISDPIRRERAWGWCCQAYDAMQAHLEEQEIKDREARMLREGLRALRKSYELPDYWPLSPDREARYHKAALELLRKFGHS